MSKHGEPWKVLTHMVADANGCEVLLNDREIDRAVACVNALAGVNVELFAKRLAEVRADAAMGCLGCRDEDYEGYPCPSCDAVEWLRNFSLEVT